MSGFEDAKNAILREARENGGLSPQGLFDLIVASHADMKQRTERRAKPKMQALHRADDPLELNFASVRMETTEEGDIKRAWRVGKWVLMAVGIFLLNGLLLWIVEKMAGS